MNGFPGEGERPGGRSRVRRVDPDKDHPQAGPLRSTGLSTQKELRWFTMRVFPHRAFELRSEDGVVGTVWEPAFRAEGHATAADGQ